MFYVEFDSLRLVTTSIQSVSTFDARDIYMVPLIHLHEHVQNVINVNMLDRHP